MADQLLIMLLAIPNPNLAQAARQLQLAVVTCTCGLLSDYPRSGPYILSRLDILEAGMGAASTGQRALGCGERCRGTVRLSHVRGVL